MVDHADCQPFGVLLREFRLAAGLSQEVLAERARISSDGVGALERGVNKAPQRETLALLIEALQLAPEQRRVLEAAAARPSRPRAASRTSKKHNLPRPPTQLFGRERDVAAVEQLIAASRIVTLTGAGGVGKTRLAIDAGLAALSHYHDGVWFVDLAPVHDAAGVAGAIAATFGVRERPERAMLDGIADTLTQRDLLLVLDNCEQVAAAAAQAVESLLTSCPEVRVLATSRQPLHVSGEQSYRVGSLDVRAATSLFLDCARRADASFAIDEAELPAIQHICRRLDGIALAIELAAARVKLLSLAQIEELLAERFAVLTGGGRLARHRTMLAVIDWSYDLLTEQERALFSRLGVFAADFSLEAAVAVCSDGLRQAMMLELLGSLVDKSLVTSERGGKARRFRLLETMRAYALERAGAETDALRRRHAEFHLQLAQGAETAPASSVALEREYENFRQALDWSIEEGHDVALGVALLTALREFLLLRGSSADLARRAERALNGDIALAPALEATAWEALAAFRGDLLMPAKALEAAERALELYERLGDLAGVARNLRSRAIAYLRLGSIEPAEKDVMRSLELSRVHGDRRDITRTLGTLAVYYQLSGRLAEARKTTLEALEMARTGGYDRTEWVTLMNLAETHFALGETLEAVSRAEEMLANEIARKNVRMRANAESNLAAYLIALHREGDARAMARRAMFDAREARDAGLVAVALGHLAATLASHDAPDAARLLGYVDGVFATGYRRENTERYTHGLLVSALHERLSDDQIATLVREGGAMSEAQAIRIATRTHGEYTRG